jgi:hypothetical protein
MKEEGTHADDCDALPLRVALPDALEPAAALPVALALALISAPMEKLPLVAKTSSMLVTLTNARV